MIFGFLVVAISLGAMEIKKETAGFDGVLQKRLAPLKEEAQYLQEKMKAFDAFMQQEDWDEDVLKKLFEEYEELAEEIDIFPLRYWALLSEACFQHRLDRKADKLLEEHSTLYREVIFGLFKHNTVIFDSKKADRAFRDMQASLNRQDISVYAIAVSDLHTYKNWSSDQYKGIQRYINGRAEFFLKKLKERKLYKAWQPAKGYEAHKKERQDVSFERQREEFSQSAESDMHQLPEKHEHSVDAFNGPERRDIKNIFTTFTSGEKALEQRTEVKRVAQRWFLVDMREKWLRPQLLLYRVNSLFRFIGV
jgi:hypothetical protein